MGNLKLKNPKIKAEKNGNPYFLVFFNTSFFNIAFKGNCTKIALCVLLVVLIGLT